jgi:hypothetical protein
MKKPISVDEVRKVREELTKMGLIKDSGRRKKGQIVWVLSPRGKRIAADLAKDNTKH